MTTDDRFDGQDLSLVGANDDAAGDATHHRDSIKNRDNDTTGADASVRAFIDRSSEAPSGVGKLMLSIQSELNVGRLDDDDPRLIRSFAASSGRAANDNVIWVGEDGEGGGIYARDASAITLTNGDIAVAWIGADQIVHARVYSAASEDHFEFPSEHPLTLKATLADLGSASALSHSLQSRLKLSALPESGFVASWTTNLALSTILFSKAFLPADSAFAEIWPGDAHTFKAHDLPPLALSKGHTAFDVRAVGPKKIEVALTDRDGNARSVSLTLDGHDESHVVTLTSDSEAPTVELAALAATPINWIETNSGASADVEDLAMRDQATVDRATGGRSDNADAELVERRDGSEDAAAAGETPVTTSGPEIAQLGPMTPIVVASVSMDALIAEVQQKLAQSVGQSGAGGTIQLGNGEQPDTVSITVNGTSVTSSALLISDNGLDVGPVASNVDGNTGLTFVEKTTGTGGTDTTSLRVAVVTEDGEIVGGAPVTVATATEPGTTFSQLDMASAANHHHDAGDVHYGGGQGDDRAQSNGGSNSETTSNDGADVSGPIGPPDVDAPDSSCLTVAVVWVGNADSDGYGTVSTQLLSVTEPTSDGTSQGSIATIDSNGDAEGTRVDLNGNSDADVIGRAPTVEGLADGSLAIAWVQRSDDCEREEVCAVVVDPNSGDSVQALDLSEAMANGIAAGTSPELLATAQGELIVSWLQAALSGGYDVAAQLFNELSGSWQSNGDVIILAHFDNLPTQFSITAATMTQHGDDALSLALAWHDGDGNVLSASITIDQGSSSGPSGEVQRTNNDVNNSDCGRESDQDNSGSGNSGFGNGGSENSGRGNSNDFATCAAADEPTVTVVVAATNSDGASITSIPGALESLLAVVNAVQEAVTASATATEDASSTPPVSAIDLGSDCISFAPEVMAPLVDDHSGDDCGGNQSGSNSGASEGGRANSGPSLADLDCTISALTLNDDDGRSSNSGQGSKNSGSQKSDSSSGSSNNSGSSGNSGSGSSCKEGPAAMADNDNLVFFTGFGNDAPDIAIASVPDDTAITHDAIVALFDDLQLANVLNQMVNEDILTFDADNVVTIKHVNGHGGKGGGDYFDSA